jgi:hypothetical protein
VKPIPWEQCPAVQIPAQVFRLLSGRVVPFPQCWHSQGYPTSLIPQCSSWSNSFYLHTWILISLRNTELVLASMSTTSGMKDHLQCHHPSSQDTTCAVQLLCFFLLSHQDPKYSTPFSRC